VIQFVILLSITQVKLSYEALQQRHEEEWTTSSSSPPTETGKAMTEWLRESQEATKELLRLKDRHIEVERNASGLLFMVSVVLSIIICSLTSEFLLILI